MPGSTKGDPRRSSGGGFFAHFAGFAAGLADYLKFRLQLAGLEAKEAAVNYVIVVALLGVAVVVLGFGYLFLCIAVIFGIAALIHGPHTWIWLTFVMALLHFAAACVAGVIARAKFSAPVFSATLDEFRKDHEWLTSMTASRP